MTCTHYKAVPLVVQDHQFLGMAGVLAPFRLYLQPTCGIILTRQYRDQLEAPPSGKEDTHPSTSAFSVPTYPTTLSNGPFRPTTKCTSKPCLRPSQKATDSCKIQ